MADSVFRKRSWIPLYRRGIRVAAAPTAGPVTASGTIAISGALAGVGTSRAAGTIAIPGDLAATGLSLEYAVGTIAISGDLAGVGTSLGRGTITLIGDQVGYATHLAVGTIALSGDLTAGGGTQFTSGTIATSGDLAGTAVNLAAGPIGISGDLTVGGGTQFALGTIALSGDLHANGVDISDPTIYAVGTIQISGEVAASGTQLAFGTISAVGELAAIGTGFAYAVGSVSISGDLAANGSSLAFGTITLIGEQAGVGVQSAQGTVQITGDLAAVGQNILVPAAGTVNLSGSLTTGGGLHRAAGTVAISGDLAANGQVFVPGTQAAGTISLQGSLFANGINFVPITAKGAISIIGTLAALEEPSDDIVTAKGHIGRFAPTRLRWRWQYGPALTAKGTISGDGAGTFYAYGSIGITGALAALGWESEPISAAGTVGIYGSSDAIGYTDPNLFFAAGSITISGDLAVQLAYPRSGIINLSGSLNAIGRKLPEGTAAMVADRAVSQIAGLAGAGTIDGQHRALIRNPYGSLQLYNNSRGGFYSIGDSAVLKEGFGTILMGGTLSALGLVDQTRLAIGAISIPGNLAVNAVTNVPTAIVLGSGTLSASGSIVNVTATINVSGNLAANGTTVTTYRLDNAGLQHTVYASGFASVSWDARSGGGVYTKAIAGPNLQYYYVNPVSEADTLHLRATRMAGDPTPNGGGTLNTWQALGTVDRYFGHTASNGEGINTITLLMELSNDGGSTVVDSATITLTARSESGQPP